MIEHRTRDGKLIYFMSRSELESLKGYRATSGGRKGRAACPMHNGVSTDSLQIDWDTGWARCWGCDDAWSIRITDHPDTRLPGDHRDGNAPGRPVKGSSRVAPPKPDLHILQNPPLESIPDDLRDRLQRAIDGAVGRLAGSPGEAYLRDRGILIDVARSLQLGWATSGPLRRRVVFPITDPEGRPTSATGRAVDDHTNPKYKALASGDGYVRTYFNGASIGRSRSSGRPLIIVEGPMDAVACVAGGVDNVVATMGVALTRPEDFRGVRSLLIAYDGDETGQKRRRRLMGDLIAEGIDVVALAAGSLGDCKDIAEYWQRHGTLPAPLVAWANGDPLPPSDPDRSSQTKSENDDIDPIGALTPDDLDMLDQLDDLLATDFPDYPEPLDAGDPVASWRRRVGWLIPPGGFTQDQLDRMSWVGDQSVRAANMSIDDLDDATRLDAEQTAAQLISEGWEACHRFLVAASGTWWLEADERVALRLVQRRIVDHGWGSRRDPAA